MAPLEEEEEEHALDEEEEEEEVEDQPEDSKHKLDRLMDADDGYKSLWP